MRSLALQLKSLQMSTDMPASGNSSDVTWLITPGQLVSFFIVFLSLLIFSFYITDGQLGETLPVIES